MAVNLDKEAYYRRIKRLYSNWKVRVRRSEACVCSLFAHFDAKGKKKKKCCCCCCWKMPAAKVSRGFFSSPTEPVDSVVGVTGMFSCPLLPHMQASVCTVLPAYIRAEAPFSFCFNPDVFFFGRMFREYRTLHAS